MNTFGLMYGREATGGTCPGSTLGGGGCLEVKLGRKLHTCYMSKVTAIYPQVKASLEANTAMLIGKPQVELEEILDNTVKEFIKKNKGDKLFFRLHYSGDFFSEEYTKAWKQVMLRFPQVQFWAYTRSLWAVQFLRDIPNLTLFISVDPVNQKLAFAIYEKNKDQTNIGLAWMGNTSPPEYKFVKCPETSGVIKNEKDKGACSKCRLCVNNYKSRVRNISFNIH